MENGKLVGILTATDLLRALEAILGGAEEGTIRIDLDVAGSGDDYRGDQLDPLDLPLSGNWHLQPESHGTRDSISASRHGRQNGGAKDV